MSTRVLITQNGEEVMYDSVSMQAFGPIFDDDTFDYGLYEFITWLEREYSVKDAAWFQATDRLRFDVAYNEWLREMRKEAA